MKRGTGAVRGFLFLLLCSFGASYAAQAAAPPSGQWIGTWAASPEAQPNTTPVAGTDGTTFREIVHTSIGGNLVRVILTNEFGLEPLTVSAATIAISTGNGAIEPSAAKSLSFGGQASVTLPAGALMVSDPVDLKLPVAADVAVSLFLPVQTISQSTVHSYALQTNYKAAGNVIDARTLPNPTQVSSWYFIKGVAVETDGKSTASGVVVALGDSITDGAASKPNKNGRWPDILARRIQADKTLSGMGVLNAGINGNRLLRDGDGGESALRRLDRDVLAQAGVKYLIVLEGINDIGHIVSASPSDPADTAQSLIRALEQIAVRAHAHGIKVIGATITPYENCKYASPEGEKMRIAINEWIRSSKSLDGVADFDRITRDPSHPTRFLPAYDSGDHLHPNEAGLRAMAEGVDLGLFTQ
ncbi:MAG: GDSL family lipase [Acidobacteriales bacterium 59-55]|nr:SGNH/GDSL hydrolase family protein [Terriglobales bacterium]OJV41029.1 MAG: GDSL family lipase [Acidobacteriales bacterium 59-55]